MRILLLSLSDKTFLQESLLSPSQGYKIHHEYLKKVAYDNIGLSKTMTINVLNIHLQLTNMSIF